MAAAEELIHYFESIAENDTPNTSILSWEKAGIANRKVLHFGYRYPYNRALKLTPTYAIPDIFQRSLIEPLQNIVTTLPGFNGIPWAPDQVIINRYLHKQGIGPHTDHKKLFHDRIVCVTIGEPADMLFKHSKLSSHTVMTESRSVYIMTAEARWEFTHEMVPHKFDKPRYSITFRNIEPKYIVSPITTFVMPILASVTNIIMPVNL